MTFEHATTPFKSLYGQSVLHCYSFGPHEEDNILCIECGPLRDGALVRVQSACYTAEIFRSLDCDCHEQLHRSLERLHSEGGLLVYMICDGRGAGLLIKVRGLALGHSEGLDTHDAYRSIGIAPDPRDYARVAKVVRHAGLQRIRLLTNNPRKVAGLTEAGIAVERVPLPIPPTPDSLPYLTTKRRKMGHLLDE